MELLKAELNIKPNPDTQLNSHGLKYVAGLIEQSLNIIVLTGAGVTHPPKHSQNNIRSVSRVAYQTSDLQMDYTILYTANQRWKILY